MSFTKIHFITGNKNKLVEARAILGDTVELSNQNIESLKYRVLLKKLRDTSVEKQLQQYARLKHSLLAEHHQAKCECFFL